MNNFNLIAHTKRATKIKKVSVNMKKQKDNSHPNKKKKQQNQQQKHDESWVENPNDPVSTKDVKPESTNS